jgi:hypothetical protein
MALNGLMFARAATRRAASATSLVLAVSLVSCAHVPDTYTPAEDDLRCEHDSDCMIETQISCCSCPWEPFAINRAVSEERLRICALVDCSCVGECKCEKTSSPDDFRAVCKNNQCIRHPQARRTTQGVHLGLVIPKHIYTVGEKVKPWTP